MKLTPSTDIWFIGRTEDNSNIVYAFNRAGHMLGCGLPIFEEFNNEEDWLKRLLELGIVPESPTNK
tara:strand:- start:1244 stop:1441 length:198 start_codon:yes stop_codon:yes gene_type:complete